MRIVQKAPSIKSNKAFSAILLFAIVLVASFFRLYLLSGVPEGLQFDEAYNGYDSYSILNTLRDQYGEFLPIFARSADDYRESLYIFLTVPSIAFFGLSEFAVRFPSALLGIFTVIAVYFLGKEFFDGKIALLAALFLAVSPWHIAISRIGIRAALLPFFFCLGLFFLLKSLNKSGYLIPASMAFSIGLYTYFPARIFIPLFVTGAFIIFFEDLRKRRKETTVAFLVFLTFFIFFFRFWITSAGMARARASLDINLTRNIYYYLSYFHPWFLFLKGAINPIISVPRTGELYLFEFITVCSGLVTVLLRIKNRKYLILLLWLILYPIPAALASPAHAIRTIAGAPLFALLSSVGIFTLFRLLKSQKAR
ncbi:MAG: glycosyltransferase family 39 protein, partial [Candidatus Omnitrophica bacterium]|nr:glycosyltransferase family 39 protein [Candidatus Omnitrophota bacterium]